MANASSEMGSEGSLQQLPSEQGGEETLVLWR